MNYGKLLLTLSLIAVIFAGCAAPTTTPTSTPTKTPEVIALNGAGASFPYPLYSKWSSEYTKIKPNVQINYQSIGSGAGIRQIMERTVDFGASDAPMSDAQYANLTGILHIPTTIGAVVIVYNLPSVPSGLNLTGEVIADIFLGKIKKWSDPRITSINPGVVLPDHDIVVVHRSDGSGTTFVFSDYLSTISQEWREKVGKGTSLNWPTGIGGKGNEGVAGIISQNPYSIGYVELAYAKIQKIPYAKVKNQEGYFIEPSLESTRAAAAGAAPKLPKCHENWSRVSIVNPPGANSYPIASFTYLLVYKDQEDQAKGKALSEFIWWAIHEGQNYSPELLYVPLPQEVVKLNEEGIKLMNYKGEVFIKETK
ncbi:MAG: phosphate ABC transporter substrate-binding protein PstS [Methanocellales archaeon]